MTTATREEIEAERDLLRAIDARPLKKVRIRCALRQAARSGPFVSMRVV